MNTSSHNTATILGTLMLLSMIVVFGCLVWWPGAWLVGFLGLIASVVLAMRFAVLLTGQHILATARKRQLSAEAANRQNAIEARERRRNISAEDAEAILRGRAARGR